jgi:hypothetical protein
MSRTSLPSLGFPSALEIKSIEVSSKFCTVEETVVNAVLTRRSAVFRVSKSPLPRFSGKFPMKGRKSRCFFCVAFGGSFSWML